VRSSICIKKNNLSQIKNYANNMPQLLYIEYADIIDALFTSLRFLGLPYFTDKLSP
jgi:hypothetical protein